MTFVRATEDDHLPEPAVKREHRLVPETSIDRLAAHPGPALEPCRNGLPFTDEGDDRAASLVPCERAHRVVGQSRERNERVPDEREEAAVSIEPDDTSVRVHQRA